MAKSKASNTKQDCWRRIGVWGNVFPRCEKLADVIHCRNCTVFVEAGRNVFERKLPAYYRDQWTARLLQEEIKSTAETVSTFVFRVGAEWFSLPAKTVDSIAEHKSIHRLPHVNDKLIAGVTNIGGEILLCYSLAAILEIGKQARGEEHPQRNSFKRFMVTKLAGNRFVFPVDEVRGMTRYEPESLKEPPDTISDVARKYILGTFAIDSMEVTVLDGEELGTKLEEQAA